MKQNHTTVPEILTLPMIPLRDAVLFPGMMMPFLVGREYSLKALGSAIEKDRRLFLAAQRSAQITNPRLEDIFSIGCVGYVVESIRQDDGNTKVLVEGVERARILEAHMGDHFSVTVKLLQRSAEPDPLLAERKTELLSLLEQYAKRVPGFSAGAVLPHRTDNPGRLADLVIAYLNLDINQKQELLEITHPGERLTRVLAILQQEIGKLKVEKKLDSRVRKQMERAQREYYLSEKMKAIQRELGRNEENIAQEDVDEYRKKIESLKLPEDAKEKAIGELRRLQLMPPMSAEATVSRNYLDWILGVPWSEATREIQDLRKAQKILDEDHYGLEKIKERIIEYLATRKLSKKKNAGTILCFAGPPGVGKTSLGASIARATGRKFVRLSLGGVRDEAEIRGHRRTYIGAFPGQIIQMMKRAGTVNPVFLLDEVDKMSMDFRGDPSAALLEVLDPDHNKTFLDHYLDTHYDLSHVMFIMTANVPHNIPPALNDRMEILQLPGYTEDEKVQIATRYLIPRQLESHGLAGYKINVPEQVIRHIIRHYTREAGVRNLERELASILRKIARKIATKDPHERTLTVDAARKFLGVEHFTEMDREKTDEIGMATGLAWTERGGELLFTEATLMNGKGRLMLTGKLGKVMQESARAALSYIRSCTQQLGLSTDFYQHLDFHVHIPEGAIPKDGPSAGITMATALISALTRNPVKRDVAMTGEITLRGKVLPIGGVKEKILAAHRAGVSTIILPRKNEKDLSEIPANVRKDLTVKLVDSMDEVLPIALIKPLERKRKKSRPGITPVSRKKTKKEVILPQ
jgi:ATP-dependent Lon protease